MYVFLYIAITRIADNDIAPGTDFKDIPDDWVCPLNGTPKDGFEQQK